MASIFARISSESDKVFLTFRLFTVAFSLDQQGMESHVPDKKLPAVGDLVLVGLVIFL